MPFQDSSPVRAGPRGLRERAGSRERGLELLDAGGHREEHPVAIHLGRELVEADAGHLEVQVVQRGDDVGEGQLDADQRQLLVLPVAEEAADEGGDRSDAVQSARQQAQGAGSGGLGDRHDVRGALHLVRQHGVDLLQVEVNVLVLHEVRQVLVEFRVDGDQFLEVFHAEIAVGLVGPPDQLVDRGAGFRVPSHELFPTDVRRVERDGVRTRGARHFAFGGEALQHDEVGLTRVVEAEFVSQAAQGGQHGRGGARCGGRRNGGPRSSARLCLRDRRTERHGERGREGEGATRAHELTIGHVGFQPSKLVVIEP